MPEEYWEIHADWDAVLPARFECLARTVVTPEEFARDVLADIDDFARLKREALLAKARAVATSDQVAALDVALERIDD